jgi:hypothetical protein
MKRDRQRIDSDAIFWGLLLIAAGSVLLLGRLGFADSSWALHEFWPLIVVIIGISKLFRHRKSVWGGLWLIAIGAWLQAVTLHLYGFTYDSSWPFLLVVLGAGMIMRTIVEAARRRDADDRGERHV